jgi:Ran GTPase-activating protein (RanGAP) involved in mRNA processing and transport
MNVEVKKERLAALVAIFRSGRATNSSWCLDFDNANLCEEGIVSLSKLMDVSLHLNTLTIIHNRIDNMESACCISRSLKSHIQLNQLSLGYCELGGNPEILSVILQSDVSIINLENNNIDSLGVAKIAEYLEGNPPICHIDLDRNRLNDDDAILILHALKRNTNLTIISLLTNNFTSNGVKALLSCFFDSSSLNAISESNHTLGRIDIFHLNNFNLAGCIDRLLQLDRAQKICLALQDKDSLLNILQLYPWN